MKIMNTALAAATALALVVVKVVLSVNAITVHVNLAGAMDVSVANKSN
jgi:hypothetical protein